MAPRVFFITGTSTGFGYHLVQAVIDGGDIAVATARNPSQLSFKNAVEKKNYLALKLDVTKSADIKAAFDTAVSTFGRVDVVVNNAGYGLSGCFEEYTEEQIRTQMEVNFFGLLEVTKTALHVMRDVNKPSGGRILQVTSIGGQRGVPTFSAYCASKWAVEGATEALSHELKPEWGIKLTCVEPGGFRTDWAGRSMKFADRHPAYDHIDAKTQMGERNGTQKGDPKKGGEAMYKIATLEDPPLRVLLGSDAYGAMQTKLENYTKSVKQYESLTKGTDVEE